MKRLIVSAIALSMCVLSFAAWADRQKVDETKPAASDGFVKIIVVRGRVKVDSWDKDKIQVTGLLDEKTQQFIFDVDKSRTTIEVRLPRQVTDGWWHGQGSDLTVHIPKKSHLDVSVVSADCQVSGIDGSTEASTVSGDLSVDNVKQRVNLVTVSGDVKLRHATGRVSVKSVSGDVAVYNSRGGFKLHSVSGDVIGHDISDDFDLQSISGDVEMSDVEFKQVSGSSVSGDVDINGTMQPSGGVDLDSVSGSVKLSFKGNVDARFDLDAGNGSIHNGISDDKPEQSRYTHNETLQFVQGKGKGDVSISTRSGDIILERH